MTPNKLPPLPDEFQFDFHPEGGTYVLGYTADQMHAYAAEAIRQSQSLPDGWGPSHKQPWHEAEDQSQSLPAGAVAWEPIAIAPRDGSWIVLVNASNGQSATGKAAGPEFNVIPYYEWIGWPYINGQPTHWMHCPKESN